MYNAYSRKLLIIIQNISKTDQLTLLSNPQQPGSAVSVCVVVCVQVDTEEEVDEWVKAFRSLIKTIRGSHQVCNHVYFYNCVIIRPNSRCMCLPCSPTLPVQTPHYHYKTVLAMMTLILWAHLSSSEPHSYYYYIPLFGPYIITISIAANPLCVSHSISVYRLNSLDLVVVLSRILNILFTSDLFACIVRMRSARARVRVCS